MSERRSAGEWVWLKPGAGYSMDSGNLPCEISELAFDSAGDRHCPLCDDPDCCEWDCLTAPDETTGRRYVLEHVSECEMKDGHDDINPWTR